LLESTRIFFLKHAKLVAAIQLVSALAVGGGSIWYGAWYQDAQEELHERLKKKLPDAPKPTFWAVSKAGFTWDAPVPYTVLGLLLGVLSGIGVYITAIRVDELETVARNYETEQEAHAETQRYYYSSLNEHLKRYCCSQIPNFDNSCRASIYRYDAVAGVVRMVFRYCEVSRYNSKGRVTLPANDGIIGAVLQNTDDVYIKNLPPKNQAARHEKTLNKALEPYGVSIQPNTVQRLRMPSRCYYAYAIRDVQTANKFAVLVLESTNQDHFDAQQIREALKDYAACRAICPTHYPPRQRIKSLRKSMR
jgi:hypothetical protein